MSERGDAGTRPGGGPRVVGVIPARLAATRLPNKPLLEIAGSPMIEWVWRRALAARRLDDLYIATPDRAVLDAVGAFGGKAIMTSDRHRSGTDRIAEAARNIPCDIVVNVQGDEPLLDPGYVDRAAEALLDDPALEMASLMCPCPTEEVDNPATVKVVCALNGDALYFSRFGVPFRRSDRETVVPMQHIGLYAYRREFLFRFAALPPTPLERAESLEQMRVLEHGHRIRLVAVPRAPLSVDTPEDLKKVRRILAGPHG
ncbi:MAG: 3-deoxy-manno-octulosonate cytidylyltransferase [Chthonomonadales bacterium]|nr:3-deoxy-manno-octulosonate cytidylyltransferase [Chthonomonadales bacterium]